MASKISFLAIGLAFGLLIFLYLDSHINEKNQLLEIEVLKRKNVEDSLIIEIECIKNKIINDSIINAKKDSIIIKNIAISKRLSPNDASKLWSEQLRQMSR